MAKFPNGRILIFAKAPVPGTVKTRLMPHLNAKQCAKLQEQLITQTIKTALNAKLCPVELWCSPDINHPFLKSLHSDFNIPLRIQKGKDLGQRMFHALQTSLETSDFTILIGSDCPALDANYLKTACDNLQDDNIVLGPAEDGGYVLIGATHTQTEHFQNINWGTKDVYQQTTENIKNVDQTWTSLSTLWDIDRPEDLKKLSNLNYDFDFT